MTYADLDKYANVGRLRANAVPQSDIDQATAALLEVDDFVRQGGDAPELQERLDRLHRTRWASLTTLPRLAPTSEDIQTWLRWRNLDLDPVEYWRRIRVPVLLLYGEQDEVVPVDVRARRIEDALRDSGNPNVTVRVFPRENHTISGSQEFLFDPLAACRGHEAVNPREEPAGERADHATRVRESQLPAGRPAHRLAWQRSPAIRPCAQVPALRARVRGQRLRHPPAPLSCMPGRRTWLGCRVNRRGPRRHLHPAE